MNNQRFFDFLNNNLIKNAYLDTAMEETRLFLTASANKSASNTNISLLQSDLTLLQARLSHWHQIQAHTDSRTVTTEITKLYHDFIAFTKSIDNLPEIGYSDFGQITVKEAINVSIGIRPTPEDEGRREADKKYYETLQGVKRFWWLIALWLLFIIFGIGGVIGASGGCNGLRDTVKSFSITTTPSSSNECILKVYHGCKLYAQPDEDALIIMDVPTEESYKPIESKGLKTKFGEKIVFFKIKVSTTEGWVKYSQMNLKKTSECFEIEKTTLQKLSAIVPLPKESISSKPSSHTSPNNPTHESKFDKMQDEFKKAESDFNKKHEALKKENEKGFNEAMKEGEKIKKEVMSKFSK